MIQFRTHGMVGSSSAMQSLRDLIERAAPLDLPVLIQGPTGSGKELVARALHEGSGRRGRFVAINVCAIPEAMFEATLFGHVRGAFTGATTDARGYLEEADHGTIFLDEISGLPLPLQAKLLRVIETREFRPIGARADRTSDFRLLAATNEPVEALVAEGRFRVDLAHRLMGMVINVPPLHERLSDVPALVRHFINNVVPEGCTVDVRDGALGVLYQHEWPGNVRELRMVVERALALSNQKVITRQDMLHALRAGGLNGKRHWESPERNRLRQLLEECSWDTALAAKRLGVHRATVYRRMQRFGIKIPADAGYTVSS